MPNGVPYDGSSENNDLGLGAYSANITHGTYFSSVVNAVTGYSIYLPPEYATNPDQRFNVIYFLTGCMSSEHFGQLAWQFKRMSGSSGLKVQAAIACCCRRRLCSMVFRLIFSLRSRM